MVPTTPGQSHTDRLQCRFFLPFKFRGHFSDSLLYLISRVLATPHHACEHIFLIGIFFSKADSDEDEKRDRGKCDKRIIQKRWNYANTLFVSKILHRERFSPLFVATTLHQNCFIKPQHKKDDKTSSTTLLLGSPSVFYGQCFSPLIFHEIRERPGLKVQSRIHLQDRAEKNSVFVRDESGPWDGTCQ